MFLNRNISNLKQHYIFKKYKSFSVDVLWLCGWLFGRSIEERSGNASRRRILPKLFRFSRVFSYFFFKRRLLLIEKRLLLLPTQMRRIYTFFSSLNAEQRTSLLPYFLPIYFIAINFFCDYKERFNWVIEALVEVYMSNFEMLCWISTAVSFKTELI